MAVKRQKYKNTIALLLQLDDNYSHVYLYL